jgi:uncharacterized membrane protein YuzA (DUF378 family)
MIIGAINWLTIGLFNLNLVANLLGTDSFFTNTVYALVGLAGLYSITLLFRESEPVNDQA